MSDDIKRSIQSFPETINSVYKTIQPNENIVLYKGGIDIQQNNKTYNEFGLVCMRLLPSPRLVFNIPDSNEIIDRELETTIVIKELKLKSKVLITDFNIGEEISYSGAFVDKIVTGSHNSVDNVVFHLVNFRDYYGNPTREGETTFRHNRLEFEISDWKVYIDGIGKTSNLIDKLKSQGGFAITHVGKVERKDKGMFSLQQAQDFIRVLGYFVSFLNAMWTHPVFLVGFTGNNKIWEDWTVVHLTSWHYVSTWFQYHHVKEMKLVEEAFQEFSNKWNSSLWRDPIISAMHWYIDANSSNISVEGKIVLACTALELIGWVYLVRETSKMSQGQFDRSSSNSLRNLLQEMQIPTSVPTEMVSIHSFMQSSNINDGPDALIQMRNRIVHPPARPGQNYITSYSMNTRQELKELGLWYLELAILHLLGYKGEYYRRYLHGYYNEVSAKVPWS